MGLVSLLHPRPTGALAILVCLQEALCPLSSLSCENSVSVAIAKIMAPRPLMPAQWKYGHRIFLPGKRETQRASASRSVPHFLRNREGFYILMKVLLFCFSPANFQNSHSWLRQLSNRVWCP